MQSMNGYKHKTKTMPEIDNLKRAQCPNCHGHKTKPMPDIVKKASPLHQDSIMRELSPCNKLYLKVFLYSTYRTERQTTSWGAMLCPQSLLSYFTIFSITNLWGIATLKVTYVWPVYYNMNGRQKILQALYRMAILEVINHSIMPLRINSYICLFNLLGNYPVHILQFILKSKNST